MTAERDEDEEVKQYTWSEVKIERDQRHTKVAEFPCSVKSDKNNLTLEGLIIIDGSEVQLQIPTRLPADNLHAVRAISNRDLLSGKHLNLDEFYELFGLKVGTNANLLNCSAIGGFHQNTGEDFFYYELTFGGLWTNPDDIEELVPEMGSIANMKLIPVRVHDL